jgi:hypothetical protein
MNVEEGRERKKKGKGNGGEGRGEREIMEKGYKRESLSLQKNAT